MTVSDALSCFLGSTAEDYGITYLDACAIWQAVDGDLNAYYSAASEFDPQTFYAAHLA